MNHTANATYASTAPNGGILKMPVLFLHGAYDFVCETVDSQLADPMRQDCTDLTEQIMTTGHWMTQGSRRASTPPSRAGWSPRLPELWPV